jgi:hypothetical protein
MDRWALFRLEDDFAEAHDLATAHPHRLHEIIQRWWSEARQNQVLPLVELDGYTAVAESHLARDRYDYLPDGGPILTPSPFLGFALTVMIEVPERSNASGIICAHHNCMPVRITFPGGWASYIVNDRLIVHHQ